MVVVHLLDYGAGNVRSIRNAILKAGFEIEEIKTAADIKNAQVLVFPGVGCFGPCAEFLDSGGFREALLEFIHSGKPFMGICLGMQTLFESSEESKEGKGLGIIPGAVARFPSDPSYSVPHIGWNGVNIHQKDHPAIQCFAAAAGTGSGGGSTASAGKVYFVHSYRAAVTPENADWVLTTTDYGNQRFISSIAKGNVFATQFHPEKSGSLGLEVFRSFLQYATAATAAGSSSYTSNSSSHSPTIITTTSNSDKLNSIMSKAEFLPTKVCRRIVACLDVRTNDEGDLVVTKGDKYDVREKATDVTTAGGGGEEAEGAAANGAGASGANTKTAVRNLGKPVDLSARYYDEGADEVAFLNITAFREEPLEDLPMLAVLESASERVFVPLTIGGGIRSYTDSKGKAYSALDVAARYFRAGADKISVGSDAVTASEAYYARNNTADGSTAIEQIARVYGAQAVVVSVDPRRVYVSSPQDPECVSRGHVVVKLTSDSRKGPQGEEYAWYQCTIKGGREGRPLCAVQLAVAVEALGAGELLVNCVDNDGQKNGFDSDLLSAVCNAVRIPVIASSGAGVPKHFEDVFAQTRVEAALAAGIFHRREVAIADVKKSVSAAGIETRLVV